MEKDCLPRVGPRARFSLQTDLQGNARVLWEPKGDDMIWAISSPDGHHAALPGFAFSSNIWSMQDF